MRLQPHEVEAIRAAVREVFGPTARTRLFESRVRDDLRGGDIDLFVEAEPGQASIADVLLHEREGVLTPLARIALRDGVPL